MVDLCRRDVGVLACCARTESLAGFAPAGALTIRVAPDETWALSRPETLPTIRAQFETHLPGDPGALCHEISSGVAVWTLSGDWRPLYSSLCAVEPAGSSCVQGLFAHVPAMLVHTDATLLIATSASVAGFVQERISQVAGTTTLRELDTAPLPDEFLGRQ